MVFWLPKDAGVQRNKCWQTNAGNSEIGEVSSHLNDLKEDHVPKCKERLQKMQKPDGDPRRAPPSPVKNRC